jgi:hypothetical protein
MKEANHNKTRATALIGFRSYQRLNSGWTSTGWRRDGTGRAPPKGMVSAMVGGGFDVF